MSNSRWWGQCLAHRQTVEIDIFGHIIPGASCAVSFPPEGQLLLSNSPCVPATPRAGKTLISAYRLFPNCRRKWFDSTSSLWTEEKYGDRKRNLYIVNWSKKPTLKICLQPPHHHNILQAQFTVSGAATLHKWHPQKHVSKRSWGEWVCTPSRNKWHTIEQFQLP